MFDPSAAAAGTIPTTTINPNGIIYLFNESSIGLRLTLPGGYTGVLPPWYVRAFMVPIAGAIGWQQLYTLSSSGSPLSEVHGEAYENAEITLAQLPQGPLMRQANIGNNVAVSANQSIINDGAAAGSTVVEATEIGSPQHNVLIDNAGNFLLQQYIGGVITTLLQISAGLANGTSNVLLGDGNHQTEVLGSLKVDGLTLLGATQLFGTLSLQPGTAIQLLAGTLRRVQLFQALGGSGTVTITHNWGVIPDYAIAFYQAGSTPFGTAPNTAPYVYNRTTTQATFSGEVGYNGGVLLIGL